MYQTEIHIKGKINPNWSDWFGELQMIENACDETILLGKLPDMAAVYGVISRLGSLVIPLISVSCVEELEPNERNLPDEQADTRVGKAPTVL
jgi:hypothetical protein